MKTTVNQTRDVAVLNMVVPTELMHLFLPSMVDRKAGGVLNISSTAGAVPGPLFSVRLGVTLWRRVPSSESRRFLLPCETDRGWRGGLNVERPLRVLLSPPLYLC